MEVLLKVTLALICLLVSVSCFASGPWPLHSHNDYEQSEPFWDAYRNRFQSIEADVWLTLFGHIKVAHTPWQNKGRFEELYLVPLQEVTDLNPHGRYILWIDIKDPRPMLLRKLARMLKHYPMIGKRVEVVMTGMLFAKKKFLRNNPQLPVSRDSEEISAFTLTNSDISWFSLPWYKHFSWNGQGEMPLMEYYQLLSMVREIHSANKKIRFYDSPDTINYWKVLKRTQVDLIDTDHLAPLAQFWSSVLI